MSRELQISAEGREQPYDMALGGGVLLGADLEGAVLIGHGNHQLQAAVVLMTEGAAGVDGGAAALIVGVAHVGNAVEQGRQHTSVRFDQLDLVDSLALVGGHAQFKHGARVHL